MGRSTKRFLACRLADLLGGLEAHEVPDQGLADLLANWAGHHVARCPRCRSRQAQWNHLVQLLRRMDRPQAPPHLYAQVMARIAVEGRSAGSVPARRAPDTKGFPGLRRRAGPPAPAGNLVCGSLALGMGALVAGVLSARRPVLEGIGRSLEGLVGSVVLSWERVGSWLVSWRHGLEASWLALRSTGLDLLDGSYGWGFWTAVGLVNALAIMTLTLGWRREQS